MQNLLLAISAFLVLMGATTVVIGAIRYFFPAVEDFFPDSFKRPLSFRYGSYYLLAGLLLILILN